MYRRFLARRLPRSGPIRAGGFAIWGTFLCWGPALLAKRVLSARPVEMVALGVGGVNPKLRFEEFSKEAAGPPVTDWHGPGRHLRGSFPCKGCGVANPRGRMLYLKALNGAVAQPVSKFSKCTPGSTILKTLNFVGPHVPPALLDNLPPFAPAPSPRHGPRLNFPQSPREVHPRLVTLSG